ncbi:hypothetical protein GW17_00035581 [Ensete ventricosum]|nr:hypothetical protein GW17_00035581 [Ensete ventricosum]
MAPAPVAAGTTVGRGGQVPGEGGAMARAIAKLQPATGRASDSGSGLELGRDRRRVMDSVPAAAAANRREEIMGLGVDMEDRVVASVQVVVVVVAMEDHMVASVQVVVAMEDLVMASVQVVVDMQVVVVDGASVVDGRRSTGITTAVKDV